MKLIRKDIEKADGLLKIKGIVEADNQYIKAYKGAISSFGAAIVYSGLDAAVKFYARKQTSASVDKSKILDVIQAFTEENNAGLTVKEVERALVAMKLALRFYKGIEGREGKEENNSDQEDQNNEEERLATIEENRVFGAGKKWENVEEFLKEEKIPNLGRYFFKNYYCKDFTRDAKVRVNKKVGRNKWEFEESLFYMQYIRMNNSIKAYELTRELCEKSAYNSLSSLKGYTCFDLSTTYPGALLGSGLPHGVGEKGEIKIGFQFDYTSGLPYIPGSSIKGVLKSMFKESANSYLVDKLSEILQSDVILSPEEFKAFREDVFENGNIVFLDSEIVLPNGTDHMRIIGDDFVTPHSKPLKEPQPIQFLKILPGVTFRFSFLIKGKVLCGERKISENDLKKLFKSILLDTGIGAKTNIGYGRLVEPVVFMLGGNDLEMMEIREMLKNCHIAFCDRGLGWNNACLSAYSRELQEYEKKGYRVLCVELKQDIYNIIDHHNEYNSRKSSLEQVADVIGVRLTREQQLVAANDSAYIPGMLALKANDKEIAEIRLRDRQAQGATKEDEQNAEKSIKENLASHKNITVVKSLTPRFSCICDRLYHNDSLLVYTDSEWTYYGVYKQLLIEHFASEIAEGKVYYGGSESGYVGMGQGVLPADQIESIVKDIVKVIENA